MRGRSIRIVAVLVLLFAGALRADLKRIRYAAAESNGPLGPCRGAVRLVDECPTGQPVASSVREFALPADGDLAVELRNGCSVRAELASEDCWAAPVAVRDQTAETAAPLYRAARISGTIRVGRGERAPRQLVANVQLSRTATDRSTTLLNVLPVSCVIEGGRWSCAVPAVPIDVRLSAPDFAPSYVLGITPPAGGSMDVGAIDLIPGASVSGWITVRDRAARTNGINVELVRTASGGRRGVKVQNPATTTNARGFFQIRGVAAGSYAVVAHKEGWSPAQSGPVVVPSGGAVEIDQPLIIGKLASLAVWTDVPASSAGRWTVELAQVDHYTTSATKIANGVVSPFQPWTRTGLNQGQYLLTLTDPRGNVRLRERFDIDSDQANVRLHVDEIPIRGRITAGGKPLQAAIGLTWTDGAKIQIESDEEGNFESSLPHEGTWRVQIASRLSHAVIRGRAVEVRRRPQEEYARLDISLPPGVVRGSVVDEYDHPVSGALVEIFRGVRSEATLTTDQLGEFELRGAEEGPAMLGARTPDADSGYVAYSVGRDETPARLVVTPRRKMSIRIVDPFGSPLAGARIRYVTAGFGPAREETSDPDGLLQISAPRSSVAVDVAVLAAGLPIKVVTVPFSGEIATVSVGGAGGVLTVALAGIPPWPAIRNERSGFLSLRYLLSPTGEGVADNITREGFAFSVEAGSYVLCPEPAQSERCLTSVLAPGQKVLVNGRDLWSPDERRRRTDSP